MWSALLAWGLGAGTADGGCGELTARLAGQLPQLRKGRVEVAACVREPGLRVIIVLQAPGGGDPLVLAGGPDGARVRAAVDGWTSEPLVVLPAGDDLALVRAAFEPVRPVSVSAHDAVWAVDVVLRDGDRTRSELPGARRMAEALTHRVVRVYTSAAWSAVQDDAAGKLVERLGLPEEQARAVVALGCRDLGDLVLMDPAAVAGAVGGDELARELIERAAWASERGEPGVRWRGW